MSKKTFTTAFNRSVSSVRDCNLVKFEKPSKVKQSLSYAVDINTIYDNYCKTGRLPLNGQAPVYDENFVVYNDLIEAQKLVNEASAYFAGLPSKIKNQYGNSLEKFVQALNNKDDFLIEEGLLRLPNSEKSDDLKPSDFVNTSNVVIKGSNNDNSDINNNNINNTNDNNTVSTD